jgi:hypothetical protein
MIGFGERDLADSYFTAANALVGRVRKRKVDGRDLVNPILFLYRQGVELYLKAIVQPVKRNHDLAALFEAFRHHVQSRYAQELPEWFTGAISELARYDPYADVFRYAESRARRLANEGEFWVDLTKLRRHMRFVQWALVRTLTADEHGLRDLNVMVPPPRGKPPR